VTAGAPGAAPALLQKESDFQQKRPEQDRFDVGERGENGGKPRFHDRAASCSACSCRESAGQWLISLSAPSFSRLEKIGFVRQNSSFLSPRDAVISDLQSPRNSPTGNPQGIHPLAMDAPRFSTKQERNQDNKCKYPELPQWLLAWISQTEEVHRG
jgi:hypothetical protein